MQILLYIYFAMFCLSKNRHVLSFRKNLIKQTPIFREHSNIMTDFIQDKKLISISPGGFRGFYMFGIGKFIKENYNLDKFIFSGASAGSWVSLFLCYRGNIDDITKILFTKDLKNMNSIMEMENTVRTRILTNFKTEDFDLKRLFVGVSVLKGFKFNTIVYSDFINLEDAINCCIASSHIPFVTGGMNNKYQNLYSYDGGFSEYPYLEGIEPVLHITPYLWDKPENTIDYREYTTLFSKNKYNFTKLIEEGYLDTFSNKEYIDKLLL
jgi:hypothetical protein